ncbi:hypothetical protein AAVH_12302 [Aphelenchoides avenae]|nr:hypothetical protein AAVH_12302 [Aphelenchus avenae]
MRIKRPDSCTKQPSAFKTPLLNALHRRQPSKQLQRWTELSVQTQTIYTLEHTFRTSKLRERPVPTSSVAVQADVQTPTKTVAVETTPPPAVPDGSAPASSVSRDHAPDVTPIPRPGDASTPTGNSSQSGTTSSSLLSSELSAGQISFHRAAIMVARSHYTSVVSVRQDGSLYRLPESFRPSAATRLDQTPTSSKPRGTHREFIRFSEERLMRTSEPVGCGNANLSGFDERLARQSPFSSTPLYPPRSRTPQLRHPPVHGTYAVGSAVASTHSHPPQRSGPCVREWEDESDWMGNASTEGTGTMPALLAREVSIRTINDSFDADRRNANVTGKNADDLNDLGELSQDFGEVINASSRSIAAPQSEEEEESTLNQISPLPTG